MGSHLAGFSPADSTPTVSPPAEPPPAKPPPIQVRPPGIKAHNTDILASTEQDDPVDTVIPILKSKSDIPILQSISVLPFLTTKSSKPAHLRLFPHDDYNIHGEHITVHNTDILAPTEPDDPVDDVLPILKSTITPILKSVLPFFTSNELPNSQSKFGLPILQSKSNSVIPILQPNKLPILKSSQLPILKSSKLSILKSRKHIPHVDTGLPILKSKSDIPIFKSANPEQRQIIPLADPYIHGEYVNAHNTDILASTEQDDLKILCL